MRCDSEDSRIAHIYSVQSSNPRNPLTDKTCIIQLIFVNERRTSTGVSARQLLYLWPEVQQLFEISTAVVPRQPAGVLRDEGRTMLA